MPTVLPVKFPYIVHELWFDPVASGACMGDHVIVSTERGTEIGLVTRDSFVVPEEELGETLGEATLSSVVRIATEEDLARADELACKGEEALPIFHRLAKASGLEIKPVGVEYLFDGEKAVCYFAAEERVDFRQLVRDLSHELHERIDMRQIGVREEAAIVGGYAHCGQELCCRRFGREFEPVSIRMAKEQDLPLNSSKISGACGRLMCCLRYEFEAYREFKSRAPKRNAVIDTPLGKAKIVEYNTPKEEVCLRLESGKQIRVPLAEMDASEAACAKSKELGCACRPDTVSRSTLDKLSSPEIQMALAELDRKNGLLPEESIDEQDIFVEPTKRQRRARRTTQSSNSNFLSDSSMAAEKPENPVHNTQEHPSGSRRRSEHRELGVAPTKTRRERRKNMVFEQSTMTSDVTQAKAPTKRRHHRAAAPHQTMDSATTKTSGQMTSKPAGSHKVRRVRRPGDKGGTVGAPASERAENTNRPGRSSRSQHVAKHGRKPESTAHTSGAEHTSTPKARRRRRRPSGEGSKTSE
ncbi:PSP1 domain-containing protein [Atopobium fossor]|uniref:PSP1 domain-containing protein n=1 Tax=Atopobium fossor TaxID=39487 RepID=UPI0003F5E2B5|nr:regulatory iron-sulfur-containing complex subunit RicT [Atopobium fossor]